MKIAVLSFQVDLKFIGEIQIKGTVAPLLYYAIDV